MSSDSLIPRGVHGGVVLSLDSGHHRLTIPQGEDGRFRLAQLDDYMHLPRRDFPWRPPLSISLEARSSQSEIPGTRGFGLWNDPFNFSLGFGGGNLLPILPNAAWFFFASSNNHLAFRDDLPASGALAATFQAPRIPAWLMAPAMLAFPLLILRPLGRLARKLASRLIRQDAVQLDLDPTEWHSYRMDWDQEKVLFFIDGQLVHSTPVTPHGPLGFVLWIDNQYAAWTPDGRMQYGRLATPEAWFEIKNISIQPGFLETS